MRRVFWAHAARRLGKRSKRSILETRAHCFDSDEHGAPEGDSALCGLRYTALARIPIDEVLAARNGASRKTELCGRCREFDPGVYLNEDSMKTKKTTKKPKMTAARRVRRPARKPEAEEPGIIDVTLNTQEIRGKLYGVGAVEVRLGPAPLPGVAVRAGDEKRVTTRDHAPRWLAERGLEFAEAEEFVAEGLGEAPSRPENVDWPDKTLALVNCKACDGQFWAGELVRVVDAETMIHDDCFRDWAAATKPRLRSATQCGAPSLPQVNRDKIVGPRCILEGGHEGAHRISGGMEFEIG